MGGGVSQFPSVALSEKRVFVVTGGNGGKLRPKRPVSSCFFLFLFFFFFVFFFCVCVCVCVFSNII